MRKKFEDQYTASIEVSFKEDAMNEFYKKALEEKKIQPINKAEITKLQFDAEKISIKPSLSFKINSQLSVFENKGKLSPAVFKNILYLVL